MRINLNYWRVGLVNFLVGIFLVACAQFIPITPQKVQNSHAQPFVLLVAAAASLQKALQEITPLYTKANPSQTINYNFAASGPLQQQIEQGAPVDIFISAADKQMNALQKKGLLAAGSPQNLLTNQLVLITPKQKSGSLADIKQLIKPAVQRISIGEPRTVPVGQYATEVLKNLGILEQIQSKFVFGNNVKSVLTAVETGNVDAGIVYITDAKDSEQVAVIATIDEQLHSPIHYPIAVLQSSKFLEESQRYMKFLQSDSAKTIFKKYGFGIANS